MFKTILQVLKHTENQEFVPFVGIICIFQSPEYIWSEEYQVKLLSKHFEAFDQLRNESFFIGEMIWNFADFNTAQSKYRTMLLRSFMKHFNSEEFMRNYQFFKKNYFLIETMNVSGSYRHYLVFH
jgi:hypothetical protein